MTTRRRRLVIFLTISVLVVLITVLGFHFRASTTSARVHRLLHASDLDHHESFWEKVGLVPSSSVSSEQAISELRKLGPPAIPSLVDAAKDPKSSPNVQLTAIMVLADFDDARAANALVPMLAVGMFPVPFLTKAVSSGNTAVTNRLVDVVKDPKAADLRKAAVSCLAKSDNPQVRELLLAQATSGDAQYRRSIITMLAGYKWAGEVVTDTLEHGSSADKIAVVYVLSAMGRQDKLSAIEAATPETAGPVREAFEDAVNSLRAQRIRAATQPAPSTKSSTPGGKPGGEADVTGGG